MSFAACVDPDWVYSGVHIHVTYFDKKYYAYVSCDSIWNNYDITHTHKTVYGLMKKLITLSHLSVKGSLSIKFSDVLDNKPIDIILRQQ